MENKKNNNKYLRNIRLNEFHSKGPDNLLELTLTLDLIGLEELEAILAALKVQTYMASAISRVYEVMGVHFLAATHFIVDALAFEEDLQGRAVGELFELGRRANHVANVSVAEQVGVELVGRILGHTFLVAEAQRAESGYLLSV